ncbi:hypothetical protein Btru_005954 [Bulinus truncatus]|nr:hypothetical protein Btru_005954 [Bulinus truncatus]
MILYPVKCFRMIQCVYECVNTHSLLLCLPQVLVLILYPVKCFKMIQCVYECCKHSVHFFVSPSGAGAATVMISFLFTTYYIVIITWSFYYMFNCFTETLPWMHCNHTWNSPHCWDGALANGTNALQPNGSRSPTEDFFIENLLERSSGISEQGALRWQLVLILLMCWIIVYFCIWKGPQSTGKVVYFTATFPYLVLLILLVRGVTLPGSEEGINFFIKPRWELLLDAKVWVNAAAQNFNSLGVAFGGLITMSSYNKFNNKIVRDVLILAAVDAFTCILAGFAVFSILGNLALNQGKSVEDVVQEGPGLVFVIYPQAFNTMPVSQMFAFLFFFMLVCLGIDSQFASVEVIVTTIQDHYSAAIEKYLKKKEILVAIVCFISFLFGLPNVTQGGFYFFQLIDYYAAALSLMFLAFFEVIAICWFYGAHRLADNIRVMTGTKPNIFFIICWFVLSPLLIGGIWVFSMVQYRPLSVADYEYPEWAVGLGWFIALLSVFCIPAGMVHAIYYAKGANLLQKFLNSLQSTVEMETSDPINKGSDEVILTKVSIGQFADQPDLNSLSKSKDFLQM